MYDEESIKWLESKGFPDAAANAELANRISLLSCRGEFEEAESLMAGITIPSVREGLEHSIFFNRTCTCITE